MANERDFIYEPISTQNKKKTGFSSVFFIILSLKNLQEDLIPYQASSTRYHSTQYNRTRVDGLNQPVVL